MRRRPLLLGVGVLALLGLAWSSFTLLMSRVGDRITRANVQRIKNGMTEAEVEAIFGCPAGNYSRKAHPWLDGLQEAEKERQNRRNAVNVQQGKDFVNELSREQPPPELCFARTWVGEDIAVLVRFKDGHVTRTDEEFLTPTELWRDRLRRLLPW
jgi:hypothetical protein